MERESTPRTVNAVDITCSILLGLRELNGAGVTELANHLGVSKSTIYSHLATLKENGLVIKRNEEYDLSFMFLNLGEYTKKRIGDNDIVFSEVDKLSDETGEVAQFATEEDGQLIYLYKAISETGVNTASRIGRRQHLHSTALGKSILAHFSEQEVDAVIEKHGLPAKTEKTITDRAELMNELEATRERGYAIDDEEAVEGLRCVAVSVLDPDGRIIGSVSVSGPSRRMKGQRFSETIPEKVAGAVNAIELNTKFS